MKKKLDLKTLEVQSFVTAVGTKKLNGAVDVVAVNANACGDTLCSPCTENPILCLFSISECPDCILPDREPIRN